MQQELPLIFETTSTARARRTAPVEGFLSSRRERINYRNRVLVARYYYWTEIKRRRFDDVMMILSEKEFFVEDRTISNALLVFDDYLSELYSKRPDSKELRKEYPNWNWDSM